MFPGINFKGRTLVPVRAITDALGATLSWDSATWTADIRSSAVASAAGGGAGGGASGVGAGGAAAGAVGGPLEDRVAGLEAEAAALTARLGQAMAPIAQLQSAGTSGSSSGTTTGSAGSVSGPASAPAGTVGIGTIATPVFPGFFKNVSYDNPALFLQIGEQTKATPVILNAAASIPDKSGIDGVAEIFRWMRAHLFLRAGACRGIPSIFVQTGRIDWIDRLVSGDQEGMIEGHILVEVYVDDQWHSA